MTYGFGIGDSVRHIKGGEPGIVTELDAGHDLGGVTTCRVVWGATSIEDANATPREDQDIQWTNKLVRVYEEGCFVDCNGNVRDVANPGYGMRCKVEGNTVLLLGEHDPEDGAEVIEECTFYASLAALAAIGFRPDENGKAASILPQVIPGK